MQCLLMAYDKAFTWQTGFKSQVQMKLFHLKSNKFLSNKKITFIIPEETGTTNLSSVRLIGLIVFLVTIV